MLPSQNRRAKGRGRHARPWRTSNIWERNAICAPEPLLIRLRYVARPGKLRRLLANCAFDLICTRRIFSIQKAEQHWRKEHMQLPLHDYHQKFGGRFVSMNEA